jgi:hypothetical protein
MVRLLGSVVLLCLISKASLAFSGEKIEISPWQIHGFIAQGIIDVDDSNYVNNIGDVSTELTEVGINASYQLNDGVRFAAQGVYLNGGNRYNDGVRLDYLLVDWSLYSNENWQTNLYLGRFKNYHWLYSSTRDVPMTRPSIVLPQSVYFDGTRDLSVGGDGAAIMTQYSNENMGELDFNLSTGKSQISSEQSEILMGQFSSGDLDHDEDIQASIYWRPHFSLWQFGIAFTDADFSYKAGNADYFFDGKLNLERLYANAEYQGEYWNLSVELLQETMTIDGVLHPLFYQDKVGQGGFVQTQYRFNEDIQFLVRYERFYADKNDKKGNRLEQATGGGIPSYFAYQNDLTLGLSYSMSENLQLQIDQHWIEGTARLTPVVVPDPTVNKKEHWQLWAIQLTYWF